MNIQIWTTYGLYFTSALDIRERRFPASVTHVMTLHSYGMHQYVCVNQEDIDNLMLLFGALKCFTKINITPIDEFIRFH